MDGIEAAALQAELEMARQEVERLRSLLAESASCISCYFNGVQMDDVIRPEAHELWRRCMVELGHDQEYIDGLNRPNAELTGPRSNDGN